ncbi:MAG: indolepyruvate oxidoreductase subunit beta [Syntrophobacterales bacterium]|nr:indolepyruvate oxidoreductase subunit beta [Syntrophobacterales bacterium]
MEREEMLRIFCVGVGGQGVLLATRLIGEAGLLAGISVSMSEVHGMAQRGGVVESAVVLGERSSAVLGEGEADVMLAFEPLEALRALPKCHSGSVAVTNTAPIPPFSVTQGGAAYPSIDTIVKIISREINRFYAIDALELALKAGSDQAVNVVLVGFLTSFMENLGKKIFPSKDLLLAALRRTVPSKIFDTNRLAFEFGYNEFRKLL